MENRLNKHFSSSTLPKTIGVHVWGTKKEKKKLKDFL
jgi:hypothetical protein